MYVALHVVMTTATDLRMASPLPPLDSLSSTSKLDLNDRTLFAVFCFIKNFIGWVVQLSIHVQTLITDFDSFFRFLVYLKKSRILIKLIRIIVKVII